jgi:hypothetical protein
VFGLLRKEDSGMKFHLLRGMKVQSTCVVNAYTFGGSGGRGQLGSSTFLMADMMPGHLRMCLDLI